VLSFVLNFPSVRNCCEKSVSVPVGIGKKWLCY